MIVDLVVAALGVELIPPKGLVAVEELVVAADVGSLIGFETEVERRMLRDSGVGVEAGDTIVIGRSSSVEVGVEVGVVIGTENSVRKSSEFEAEEKRILEERKVVLWPVVDIVASIVVIVVSIVVLAAVVVAAAVGCESKVDSMSDVERS